MSSNGSRQLKERVDVVLGRVVAGIMGLAVLNVLWQVFTRYVLHSPSGYTDELARYLLVWLGLLGGAYVAGRRMHLALDLLPQRLEGRARAALGLVIEGLIALFAISVMVVGGVRLVSLTLMLQQTSAALRIPLGYVYVVLPLSGTLITFYSVLFMLDHLRYLHGRAPVFGETTLQSAETFAADALAAAPDEPVTIEGRLR